MGGNGCKRIQIGGNRHNNKNHAGSLQTCRRYAGGHHWHCPGIRQLRAMAGRKRIDRFLATHQKMNVLAIAHQGTGDGASPATAANDDRLHRHCRTPRPGGGLASGSSGQRGRGSKSSWSGCSWRSSAAQAIIAALSVQSLAGGTTI